MLHPVLAQAEYHSLSDIGRPRSGRHVPTCRRSLQAPPARAEKGAGARFAGARALPRRGWEEGRRAGGHAAQEWEGGTVGHAGGGGSRTRTYDPRIMIPLFKPTKLYRLRGDLH
jgi:hypothetical protein